MSKDETDFGEIHVIHLRDPDSSCDMEVWINGTKVGFKEWSFDPGAGCLMEEFEENKTESVAAAPDWLKERIAEAYDDMEPVYEKWGF